MDPYLVVFQSLRNLEIPSAVERAGLVAAAAQRYAFVGKVLLYALDRMIALLQAQQAAWTAALRAHQIESRYATQRVGESVNGPAGEPGPVDEECDARQLRAPVEMGICPSCNMRFGFNAAMNGQGGGNEMSEQGDPLPGEGEVARMVEGGLRRLFDFTHLGESALADWEIVRRLTERAQGDETDAPRTVTHVDRGKALYHVLVQAVKRLRPEGELPGRLAVPAREWYRFLILHDSYVEGELNRNIMARLYIGEGTFNRERRKALRSVAKVLLEMEEAAQRERSEIDGT